MQKFLCVAGAALALGVAAPAQAGQTTRTMPAGGTLKLLGYLVLNPDCSVAPPPVLRVLSEPASGTLSIKHGMTFPNFVAPNPRAACDSRRAPSQDVIYRPAPGFVGVDHVAVEVFSFDGGSRIDEYTIYVK